MKILFFQIFFFLDNIFCNSLKKKVSYSSKLFKEDKNFINPYMFVEELSKQLKRNDIIIPDDFI